MSKNQVVKYFENRSKAPYILGAIVMLLAITFIALSLTHPMVDEDYSLYARGMSLTDIVQRGAAQYFGWNARIGDVLSIILSALPLRVYNFLNVLSILIFFGVLGLIGRLVVTGKLGGKITLHDSLGFIAIFLLFTFYFTKPNEVFFWRTGAANYFHPVLLTLIWSLPAIAILYKKNYFTLITSRSLRYVAYFGYIILGLIVGHSNENVAPVISLLMGLIAVYSYLKFKLTFKWTLAGFMSITIGTFLLLFGPSTQHRIAFYKTIFGDKSTIDNVFTNIPQVIPITVMFCVVSTLITGAILATVRPRKKTTRRVVVTLITSCAATILSGIILAASPYIVERAYFFASIASAIPIIASLYTIPASQAKISLTLLTTVCLFCLPLYISEYQKMKTYSNEKNHWIAQAKASLAENTRISMPRIKSESSKFLYVGVPSQEAERISQFFNREKNAITLEP